MPKKQLLWYGLAVGCAAIGFALTNSVLTWQGVLSACLYMLAGYLIYYSVDVTNLSNKRALEKLREVDKEYR